MPYNCVVLAKQVPDTENITGEAMKPDGTVNRGALPAIFNPEDLRALELALFVKDEYGGRVTVITMGPPGAAEVLRASLYRGVDEVALLTDMRFAGADTLATSYVLSEAVKHTGDFDIVFCGSQAIDGDTGQVGPQTAEKLGVTQICYVEQLEASNKTVKARRAVEGGYEIVECSLPVLVTVTAAAPVARPPAARNLMRFKKAKTAAEAENGAAALEKKGLLISTWDMDTLGLTAERCGKKGSPTGVVKIESVVFAASNVKQIEPTDEGVEGFLKELREEHIV
jgi:electron transfer flavoprotein beta subunit